MSGRDAPSAWTAQRALRAIIALTAFFHFFFADISVSLLTLVVTACGLALFGVSLFVSWKLCWVPWRERGLFSGGKDNNQEPLNYTDTETNEQENSEDFLDPPTPCPDSSMKISHTSPDIPLSTQPGDQENCAHATRVQRQVTEPTPSARSVMPLFLWMQGKDHLTSPCFAWLAEGPVIIEMFTQSQKHENNATLWLFARLRTLLHFHKIHKSNDWHCSYVIYLLFL